jgi:hypothetical protein
MELILQNLKLISLDKSILVSSAFTDLSYLFVDRDSENSRNEGGRDFYDKSPSRHIMLLY